MLDKDFVSFIEQVEDRLLSEPGVVVMDMAPAFEGYPDLMVMVPRRMPCFLFLHPIESERVEMTNIKDRLDSVQCTYFDVEKIEDIDFLMDTIRTLRTSGELIQPRDAVSEGFEVADDQPTPSRPSWRD